VQNAIAATNPEMWRQARQGKAPNGIGLIKTKPPEPQRLKHMQVKRKKRKGKKGGGGSLDGHPKLPKGSRREGGKTASTAKNKQRIISYKSTKRTTRQKRRIKDNEKEKKTHQPIHRPILRKYLIEPRYRCQENNSVHCGNNIHIKLVHEVERGKERGERTYHHRKRAPK